MKLKSWTFCSTLSFRFLDYSFNYDQYLNCSEEDIGYHIERYNDGKPMTSPQKGITKLGTEYAELVKAISNMPFFKDHIIPFSQR